MPAEFPFLVQNRIKAAAVAGRTAFGMYVTQSAPVLVDIAAQAGLDFIRADAYHGTLGPRGLDDLMRAAYAGGLTPSVRVDGDSTRILSALERGAMAVTVPNIHSEAAARAVVAATRYPPRGQRDSSRPPRLMGAPADAYFRWAEEELLVSVQVESLEGLAALDDIVRVDGIDMVQSGRQDLALALGFPGQSGHPKVLAAEERIVEAAWRAGKWASLHFPPAADAMDHARRWLERGVQCVTIGSDIQILFHSIRRALSEMTMRPATVPAKEIRSDHNGVMK